MCEDMVKKIYDISKEYDVNKIVILTNHLKFMGTLCECKDVKKENNKILTLMDAKMWRLNDLCNCNEPNCKCDESSFFALDWLHVNVSKIVSFTLKK